MFSNDFVIAFGEEVAYNFGISSSQDLMEFMNTQEGIDFLGMYMGYDCIPN